MNKVCWVIDDSINDRHDDYGFPSMVDAALEAGHEVIQTKYVPLSEELSDELCNKIYKCRYLPVIVYGTIGFVKQFRKFNERLVARGFGFSPGTYFKQDNLKYSMYSSIWGDLMLNDDYIILPYAELKRRLKWDIDYGQMPPYFPSKSLFVRPNEVTKSFAGRVFHFNTMEDSVYSVGNYTSVNDDDLCIMAKPKEILAEYRHVICNHELIAQSQYQHNGVLDIRIDVEPECQRLAKYISRCENDLSWEPDDVYVVDTAMTPDGPRIIEFNAFSCSGLYACDTRMIIKRVSEQAHMEKNGL